MAVRFITDHPHVHPITIPDVVGDDLRCAGVEVRGCRPACRIADVFVCRVCCIAVLVDQIPKLLGCKVKDFGCGAIAGADC